MVAQGGCTATLPAMGHARSLARHNAAGPDSGFRTGPRTACRPHSLHPGAGSMVPPGQMKIDTSFSRGLSEWLFRNGLSFVCTTYQTGHLICIGVGPEGRVMVSAACFRDAMGLIADAQRMFLASSKAIWRLENILASHESANDIYDRLYVPRNLQFTSDLDIHEMALDGAGQLVFVNTKYSCLATVSMVQAFKPLWTPPFISRLAPEDRCHLNGELR